MENTPAENCYEKLKERLLQVPHSGQSRGLPPLINRLRPSIIPTGSHAGVLPRGREEVQALHLFIPTAAAQGVEDLSTSNHLSDLKSLAAKSDRLTPDTVNAIAANTQELYLEEDNVPIVVRRGHQTRRVAVCSVAM